MASRLAGAMAAARAIIAGTAPEPETPKAETGAKAPEPVATPETDPVADPAADEPADDAVAETVADEPIAEAPAADPAPEVAADVAERARWATVLRSSKAANKTSSAVNVLASTAMSADQVLAMLDGVAVDAVAGNTVTTATATSFGARMGELGNPAVTATTATEASANPVLDVLIARHAPKKG